MADGDEIFGEVKPIGVQTTKYFRVDLPKPKEKFANKNVPAAVPKCLAVQGDTKIKIQAEEPIKEVFKVPLDIREGDVFVAPDKILPEVLKTDKPL